MSDSERTSTSTQTPPDGVPLVVPPLARDGNGVAPPPEAPEPGIAGADDLPLRKRVRVRWLRVIALLVGLGLLALTSTVFGMMMAVTRDLPEIKDPVVKNSELYDRQGKRIGLLTSAENRIINKPEFIPPVMQHAIVAIEDRRFYTNDGVDLRGIGRALWQDVASKGVVQGGSTITQQYVKNVLAAQNKRTLFNKLREAALAYHLTRGQDSWSKQKILTAYLNTIYFGNGAYGVESATRTYFGDVATGGHDCPALPARCAPQLEPAEAALLAGVVANPTQFDPIVHPAAARARRNIVLGHMLDQQLLTAQQYHDALTVELPTKATPPVEHSDYPYFTSWVKQQIVEQLGGDQSAARLAYDGGLKVRTTLDLSLQQAAQSAVNQWLPNPAGPRAAVVVLDNATAKVRAMVGGDSTPDAYSQRAFNLATQGQRQPGSAFKPFVLAEALRQGIPADSTWTSKKKVFCVLRRRGNCLEHFEVNNYEDSYVGVRTLADATTHSDNTVFAEVGIKVGPKNIARMAHQAGIRSSVSHNFAISLGGLKRGVTPLDMAHAYNTFANHGDFVYGSLSSGRDGDPVRGPVGVEEIDQGSKVLKRDQVLRKRVMPYGVAQQVSDILSTVVKNGTGKRADLGTEFAAGKTGTTENYGDAWFVGWTHRYTVAVWVGYPDKLIPMKSPNFTFTDGTPVAGGTFPAAIWKTFMEAALKIESDRKAAADAKRLAKHPELALTVTPTVTVGSGPTGAAVPAPSVSAAPTQAPAKKDPAQKAPPPDSAPPDTGQGTQTGGGTGDTDGSGGAAAPGTP